jgi:hypothetical protein
MEVICLEDSAFYELIEEVVERLGEKKGISHEPWVTPERAMEILNIKSKTTLQKLRDEGAITYSQPQRKVILYKYDSLMVYLETHSKKSF